MRKICIILLLNSLFVYTLSSQTLIQQIEDVYNALDSVSYIKNVIVSYKEDYLKLIRSSEDGMLELYKIYNNMDSIQRKNTLDSVMERYNTIMASLSYREDLTKQKVWEEMHSAHVRAITRAHFGIEDSIQRNNVIDSIVKGFSKTQLERDYSMFISAINANPVHYVLNLRVDSCGGAICLLPDTSKLPFNLFSFDKNYKGSSYVYFSSGRYDCQTSRYITFSRKIAKNAPKVFRKIMKKRPKYLLLSPELEGTNTILYVLNNKIYVYRIIEMKKYELSDYIEKFGIKSMRAENK